MIKAIDEKYCKNDMVQLMPYSSLSQLIISNDEIIFLKLGDTILVNKYENNPNRNLFPYSNKISYDGKYTQLFEYNKQYLIYRGSSGINMQQLYFFKGNNRALYFNDSLCTDDRGVEINEQLLDRRSIESIFNSDNYDSMYLVDKNGAIRFAKSKKDGVVINAKIIPSDDEIVELELKDRLSNFCIACTTMEKTARKEKLEEMKKCKTIEEIKNFKIYAPILFSKFSDILITSKDGVISVMWFKLEFVEKDKFKITTAVIPVVVPTVDDVIDYCVNNKIKNVPEPNIEDAETDFSRALKNIPDLNEEAKIRKIDYYA